MRGYTIHNIAVSWATHLNRYAQKEGIALQKMTLGIEIFLHNIPKLILIAAVAAILGILPWVAVTWASFACVRRYASGLHAANSITCTIVSLLMFVGIPYVMQDMRLDAHVFCLWLAVIALALYRYAPADTAACPIVGKKKRARLKKRAVFSCAVVMALALLLFNDAYYGLIALGTSYALILVLPITYKILKRSMNNYEKYE